MTNQKATHIILVITGMVLVLALGLVLIPLTSFESDYSKILLDRNNELLSARIAGDGQWRFPPIDTIPVKYEKALLVFEDKRFYQHFGLDPIAVGRALWSNIEAGTVVSGASTITMQVIRLSRPGRARSVTEKITEALLALHLELRHSKREILSLYASHAPFGGNVVGLEAASWRYFGCEPDRLSWAESALLAVLPNSPALIHPGRNRNRLLEKRNFLLNKMYQAGLMDSLTCELARAENLPPAPHAMPMSAPHLLARTENVSGIAKNSRYVTTIDKELQLKAKQIIERHHSINRANHIQNAAALVIDTRSGEVLAYIGNLSDFDLSENGNYVDIITAPRSTGSILKPLLYAGLLQSGEITPTQLVPDIPTNMEGFTPQNYSRSYNGAVPAWQALARSLNVPAVRMLQSYGVNRFYHLLQHLGMSTLFRPADDYGLSLILGGAECSLWDITSIYARMAYQVQLGYGVDSSKNYQVKYLIQGTKNEQTIDNMPYPLSPGAIWLTLEAMLEVARPGGENPWRSFSSSRKIAWKTGTSYGHRDAWAVGITPDMVIGVWCGNANGEGRPGLTGLNVAAPVLFDIFNIVEKGNWFVQPENDLDAVTVCVKSGYRSGVNCSESRTILTSTGNISKVCPYCKIIHVDKQRQWQISGSCESINNVVSTSWFVLPPAMEWYYKQSHSDYLPLPPIRPDCFEDRNLPLGLIYPQKNSKILVPVEIDGKIGRTVFKATHRDPAMKLFWHLNNEFIGNTEDIHQIAVAPQPGMYVLTIVDEVGNYLERRFEIVGGY